jgi:hypothetical protein
MMMQSRKLGCILITFLLLSACWRKAVNMDAGLFTGIPCKPPCWHNLTPGVSTTDDVESFLKKLDQKDWPSKNNINHKTGCNSWRISKETFGVINALFDLDIEKGTLIFISSSPPERIHLNKIVDQLGPPEYFKAVLAVGPDGQLYILEVYYPKQGLAFIISPNQNNDIGFIEPTMVIDSIEYFPPGDLQSYLTAKHSCGVGVENASADAQKTIQKYIQPWSGFGKVNVIQSR